MKRFSGAAALLAMFASSIPSQAGTLHETNVEGWVIGAYSDNRTGQFSHCATSVPYTDGTTLFFFLAKNFTWSMGLHNRKWEHNPVGRKLNLNYYIDAGPRMPAQAIMGQLGLLSIPLADSRALFQAFQLGRTLYIQDAQQTFNFQLTNSSKALSTTFECVQRYVSSTASNPFLRPGPHTQAPPPAHQRRPPQPPDVQTGSTSRPESKTEATILAANVLSASGIPGFRIVPLEQIPAASKNWDAAWVADGGLLGMVQIYTPQNASTIEQVVALLMALDSTGCKGAFTSAHYPDQGKSGVGRLMTVCKGSKAEEIHYTVTRRPNGGFYVFGVAGSGGEAVNQAGARLYEVALKTHNP